MAIKSDDIAKIVGVSRSTVSKVLNNYSNIPESTKKKVMDAIQDHGYKPNLAAQSLAGKANKVIGIMIAEVFETKPKNTDMVAYRSPYFLDFIANTANAAKENGYFVLLDFITDSSTYDDIRYLFKNRNISGGILVGFDYGLEAVSELANGDYNIVFIDLFDEKDVASKQIKTVNTNDFMGGYIATEYLIKNGHTNIVHVSGGVRRLSALKRTEGYLKALEDYHIPFNESLLLNGKFIREVAYDECLKLLSKEIPFTAIFCANDIMALGIHKALSERGLRVPQDVSMIGFDDLLFAQYMTPPLTTVKTHVDKLATSAVEILLAADADGNRSEQEPDGMHCMCGVTLMERESVRNVRVIQ